MAYRVFFCFRIERMRRLIPPRRRRRICVEAGIRESRSRSGPAWSLRSVRREYHSFEQSFTDGAARLGADMARFRIRFDAKRIDAQVRHVSEVG